MNNKPFTNLYEWLEDKNVRSHISMYLGDRKLTTMWHYINGYRAATDIHTVEQDLKPDFWLFHDFVAEHFGYSESTSGWRNMIFEQTSDEEKGLDLFFELFDKFRGQPLPQPI
jgi:hypothetical protein